MLPTRSTCESAVRTRPTMNEFGRRSSNRVRVDVINLLIMERNCDPKKKKTGMAPVTFLASSCCRSLVSDSQTRESQMASLSSGLHVHICECVD